MRHQLLCAGVAAGLVLAAQARAENAGVKVGTLSCHVGAGWGMVVGSSRKLDCTFTGSAGQSERYQGSITKVGADIGYQSAGTLVWTVFAPGADIVAGALAGDYGGATASATVGVGVGANALFGGSEKSIALQPLSVQGSTGLNVAAGVAGMKLKTTGQ